MRRMARVNIWGVSAFVLTVLFWPGLASAATTPRWAFLSIAVFATLQFTRASKITTAHVLLCLFMGYALLSFLWTPIIYDAMNIYWKFVVLAGLFWLGAEAKDLRPVVVGAALGLWINSGIVIAQVNGWAAWPQLMVPGGLFMNKDLNGEIAVMVLAAAFAYRLWWVVPGVLPSFVLPGSRSSYVAAGVVVLSWVGGRFPRLSTMFVVLAAAGVAGYFIVRHDSSVAQRVHMWLDAYPGLKLWGNGIGSFYALYPRFATRLDTLVERPEHAHNDLVDLTFELGIGALLAVAFFVSCYRHKLAAERSVLLAFFVIGCFSFPLYMPATAAFFAFAAGCLAGAGPALRDDFASWRSTVRARVVGFRRLQILLGGGRDGEPDFPARVQATERAGLSPDSLAPARRPGRASDYVGKRGAEV
jgi:hypothetical protein